MKKVGCYVIPDFNPLPRKEGDAILRYADTGERLISIHSLVKRETSAAPLHLPGTAISIHSLVKRETASRANEARSTYDFNPLPRKEGDVNLVLAAVQCSQFQSTPS